MVAMGPGSRRASRRLGRGDAKWRRFSLSDDVRFDKPNNRHDAFKVESLLGYGGYMDLEKSGGPLGLATGRLEKPIKEFQAKNGLKIDGLLKPGGPTITKMKELYGDVFGKAPAPTPAMVDANAEVTHAGEDGFLFDKGLRFGVRPNKRLDGKAHLMEFERWNREWARGSGNDPTSLAPEYDSYIRDLDAEHGHDPGLIFARDLVQQVGKFHGDANGAELAKALAVRLSDRPDLQRELLGGEIPKAPPIGMFKPGGEERIKAWIDQDRIANGVAPRYTPAQSDVPVLRTSSRAGSASQDAAQGQPDPANLLEYGPNFGLPEDWALAQQPPHEPDQPNPRPVDPPSQSDSQGKPDDKPEASRAPSAGEVDPNQMTPVPKPEVAPVPPPPALAPERRPHADATNQHLQAMIASARNAVRAADQNMGQLSDRYRMLAAQVADKQQQAFVDAAQASGAGAAEGGARYLVDADVIPGQKSPGRAPSSTMGGLLRGSAAGAAFGAAVSLSQGSRSPVEIQAELSDLREQIRNQAKTLHEARASLDALRRESELRSRRPK